MLAEDGRVVYPGIGALGAGLALETPRLKLRQFAESDVDALAQMYADPETMRHLGDGRTFSHDETWRAIASMLRHWLMRRWRAGALQLFEQESVVYATS